MVVTDPLELDGRLRKWFPTDSFGWPGTDGNRLSAVAFMYAGEISRFSGTVLGSPFNMVRTLGRIGPALFSGVFSILPSLDCPDLPVVPESADR